MKININLVEFAVLRQKRLKNVLVIRAVLGYNYYAVLSGELVVPYIRNPSIAEPNALGRQVCGKCGAAKKALNIRSYMAVRCEVCQGGSSSIKQFAPRNYKATLRELFEPYTCPAGFVHPKLHSIFEYFGIRRSKTRLNAVFFLLKPLLALQKVNNLLK